jgi:epoxyqueuosine reductase
LGGTQAVIDHVAPPDEVVDQRLETLIKAQAYGLGFDLVGITTLGPAETAAAFDEWIARGYAGEMSYLPRNADTRRDSRLPFAGATTAIVVAMNYGGAEPSGPVARYARGDDYHDVMLDRLMQLHRWIDRQVGRRVIGKAYVDTGPLLERDLARRAGLGWFGKNTMLINPRIGSFFFLGSLLVDLRLDADAPFATDHCGSCRRCLDACPTGALAQAHVLDATKCIAYLTIELKGDIPTELRPQIGELIYGCDICQEVCPWNQKFAQPLREEAFKPRPAVAGKDAATLARELLEMSQDEFSRAYKGSPMKRAKLRGLKRNAAIVLGNVGAAEPQMLHVFRPSSLPSSTPASPAAFRDR